MSTKYIHKSISLLLLVALQLFSFILLVQAGDRPSLRGLINSPPKQARIINGNVVKSDRFPYFARMLHGGCGGVLVSKRFVLTAAHCVYDPFEIYLSNDDLFGDIGFGVGAYTKLNGKLIELNRTAIHPSYEPFHLINDIALVYLTEDAVDQPYVKLSPDMINEPGISMTVIGLGSNNFYESHSSSFYLQRADIEYLDSGVCRLDYPNTKIDAGMMCASSKEGNDSCNGDSGGPLLLTPNNNYADDLLVGITSWGTGCGDSRYPGVYTRISRYYDWIVETMCTISPDSAPEYCNPVGKEADICRAKGGACHKSDECCSGRCDFFSNTCFAEIEKSEQRRGRGSTGMGGAAGGSPPARGSRSNSNTDAIRGIARDLP